MDELTAAELSYWSAVSQIAPVLGLALVIELRQLSRRWTRESGRTSFRERRRSVYISGIVATGLVSAEINSLSTLMFGASSFPLQIASGLSIGVAIVYLISNPVSALMAAALVDAPPSARKRRARTRKANDRRREFERVRRGYTQDWLETERLYLAAIDLSNEIDFTAALDDPPTLARAALMLKEASQVRALAHERWSDVAALESELDAVEGNAADYDSPERVEAREKVMVRLLALQAGD